MPDTVQLDLDRMREAAGRAAGLLRALSNEDRLLLLCQLAQGELSVGDIEARTGIGQPTLSQQLAVLRAQRLVATRRAGKRIFYRVADPKALVVLGTLYQLFCAAEPVAPATTALPAGDGVVSTSGHGGLTGTAT